MARISEFNPTNHDYHVVFDSYGFSANGIYVLWVSLVWADVSSCIGTCWIDLSNEFSHKDQFRSIFKGRTDLKKYGGRAAAS